MFSESADRIFFARRHANDGRTENNIFKITANNNKACLVRKRKKKVRLVS